MDPGVFCFGRGRILRACFDRFCPLRGLLCLRRSFGRKPVLLRREGGGLLFLSDPFHPFRVLLLRIVAHQRAEVREHTVGVLRSRREEDNGNRVFRKAQGAVIQVEDRIFRIPAVLMGNVKAPLPELEILLRLRALHGLDQAVIALSSVIKLPQAGDHLPRSEEVVFIVFVVDIVWIFTHDRGNQNPVAMVQGGRGVCLDCGPGVVPEQLGIFVVGVDDGAFQELGIPIPADGLIQCDLPLGDPVQKQHVQRHLVHAAAHTVLIPVIVVLLPCRKVVIPRRDGIGVCVVFLQHQQQPGLPVSLSGYILCRGAALSFRYFIFSARRLRILQRASFRPPRREHGKQKEQAQKQRNQAELSFISYCHGKIFSGYALSSSVWILFYHSL